MPAGPSEILVLADEDADPKLIAADMVSKLSMGADSVSGLINYFGETYFRSSQLFAKNVASAERGPIVTSALSDYGFIITCEARMKWLAWQCLCA